MRFQFAQVDLDHLVEIFFRVVIHFCIAIEVSSNLVCQLHHFFAAGGTEVAAHAVVVSKNRSGGTDLSTHITDGALSGAADVFSTFTKIFHDGTCSAFYGQDTCHFQNNIFSTGPAVHFTGQLHTDQFWHLQFPGESGHHIHSIRTTHTDSYHSQTTGIHGMAVGTDHHTARKSIVLQYYLVDDTRTGFPETDAIFLTHRSEKIKNFLIGIQRCGQVRISSCLSLDQVITMHRTGNCYFGFSCTHELQQRHLCGSILHGHAVRIEIDIGLSAFIGC